MKPYDKIYLQWHGHDADDPDCRGLDVCHDPAMSWCQDRIYDTDIEYTRGASHYAEQARDLANRLDPKYQILAYESFEVPKLLLYDVLALLRSISGETK